MSGRRVNKLGLRMGLVLYIAATIVFLLVVAFNRRGYKDEWILQDIWAPTICFIVVSLITQTLSSDNRLTAAVGAVFSSALLMIPALKYDLFYGCYDSVAHYGYIESLVSLGHVPQNGYYANLYSGVPGMHFFMGSFSIISGIPVGEILKFILPIMYGVLPLLMFFVTKGILAENVQKYVIVFSSFPIVGFIGYTVTATSFALVLFITYVVLLLSKTLSREDRRGRAYDLALITIGFALVLSHGVTSLLISILLLVLAIALIAFRRMGLQFPTQSQISSYANASMFMFVLVFAWWMFNAGIYLNTLGSFLRRILSAEQLGTLIPIRFFEIPISAQLMVFLPLHLKDVVVVVVSLIGLSSLYMKLRRRTLDDHAKKFYLYVLLFLGVVSSMILIQLIAGIGAIGYDRLLPYVIVLSPLFVGLAFSDLHEYLSTSVKKIAIRNFALVASFFVLFSLCLIQVFPYQPIVPRANIISSSLPENEFLIDLQLVNTIYKIKLISYAEEHSPANAAITSDTVTKFQIYGFSDPSFSSRHIWLSPLENSTLEWNIFLLQTDEKAGPFNERPEYRTAEKINSFRTMGNLIYDNGMSIIVQRESNQTWQHFEGP